MANQKDDNVDINLFSYLFRGGNDSSQKVISSKIPVVEYLANVYNVSHKNRGVALIFNQEVFDDRSLKPREGSSKDKKSLQRVLKKLGFDVRVYNNLKFGQLHEVLQEASIEDHTHNDCLLVCVMSHGEEGKIHARDHTYPPDLLWTPFTGNVCPSLAGKPKMFFIQACRGSEVDDGAVVRNTTEVDSSRSDDPTYRIPAMADILVMYSTYQGYFSWRSPDKGSWFIQALCTELEENGDRCDLLTLLTFVNRRVALFHQSNVPQVQAMHHKKQICTIVSMLTRIMWFPPKKQEVEDSEGGKQEKVEKVNDIEEGNKQEKTQKIEDEKVNDNEGGNKQEKTQKIEDKTGEIVEEIIHQKFSKLNLK